LRQLNDGTLVALDLYDYAVNIGEAYHYGRVLQACSALQALKFTYNYLNSVSDGASSVPREIGLVVARNSHVETLIIDHNPLDGLAVVQLLEGVVQSATLSQLSLGSMSPAFQASPLSLKTGCFEALAACAALTDLALPSNYLTDGDVGLLVGALLRDPAAPRLRRLCLDGNHLTEAWSVNRLPELVLRCPSLEELTMAAVNDDDPSNESAVAGGSDHQSPSGAAPTMMTAVGPPISAAGIDAFLAQVSDHVFGLQRLLLSWEHYCYGPLVAFVARNRENYPLRHATLATLLAAWYDTAFPAPDDDDDNDNANPFGYFSPDDEV
jgi:hypothetical protein